MEYEKNVIVEKRKGTFDNMKKFDEEVRYFWENMLRERIINNKEFLTMSIEGTYTSELYTIRIELKETNYIEIESIIDMIKKYGLVYDISIDVSITSYYMKLDIYSHYYESKTIELTSDYKASLYLNHQICKLLKNSKDWFISSPYTDSDNSYIYTVKITNDKDIIKDKVIFEIIDIYRLFNEYVKIHNLAARVYHDIKFNCEDNTITIKLNKNTLITRNKKWFF